MILKFKTDKQQLQRIDMNEAVENTQNYLTAEFTLDSDWEGKNITALFQKGNVIKEIILEEDYSCVVPSEVIRSGGFSVALLGVKGSEVITSNKVIIYVDKTIDASEATSPAEPTKSLYAQLLDRISRLEAEGIAPEVIAQAVADYLEANPIETGISEEECITLINSYIETHKSELKGDPFTYADFTPEQLEGLRGKRGKSAYEIAVEEEWFEGTKWEYLDSLQGESAYISVKDWTVQGVNKGIVVTGRDHYGEKVGYVKHGVDGKDGYTPIKGVDYFDGDPGNDGYTPIKGVDYFTQADKQELINAILNSLPVAEGELF